MSNVERRLDVAAHEIRGRKFLVERTAWANGAGLSYDVYDELTGLCLTPQSLDQPPSRQQLFDHLQALGQAHRDGALEPFHHAERDALTAILDHVCPLDVDVDGNDPSADHRRPSPRGSGSDGADDLADERAGGARADGLLEPEPDASCQEITDVPRVGELGAHAFGRDIAVHLARLLGGPVSGMRFRENPWDRRRCPKAWFYEFDVAGYRVEIACRETRHPLRRDSFTRYTLTLDGQPVPYQPNPYEAPAWQIAREIWIAWLDTFPRPAHHASSNGPNSANERA